MVGYLLFVYGAALIGSYACNKREREFRYTYLHRRIIEDNKVCNGLVGRIVRDHKIKCNKRREGKK